LSHLARQEVASSSESGSSDEEWEDTNDIPEHTFQMKGYVNYATLQSVQNLPETTLIQRANEGSREVLEVRAGETKSIDIAATEKKTIFTHAMNGCYAFTFISMEQDGKRRASMSHHPEIGLPVLIEEITQSSDAHRRKQSVAFIVAPQTTSQETESKNIESLSQLARSLGASNVILVRYKPGADLETKGSAFILNIPTLNSSESYSYEAFSRKESFTLS